MVLSFQEYQRLLIENIPATAHLTTECNLCLPSPPSKFHLGTGIGPDS